MPSADAPPTTVGGRSPTPLVARLSVMMFLHAWPLGAWGVTFATFITANTGAEGDGIYSPGFAGYCTAAGAIGGLIAPAVVGWLSDRYFSAQRLLALMHLGCAGAVWWMYLCRTQSGFFVALLVYFHCYVPAASLVCKIGLRHLRNSDAEFPLIRVFGTIGWIAAGLFVGLIWPSIAGRSIEATRMPFLIGAVADLAMACYALTLPHTPPERGTNAAFSTWKGALSVFANGPLAIFLFLALLTCVPSMAYNNFSNPYLNFCDFRNPAALLTLGQVSELVCLWFMPRLIGAIGLRSLFFLGVFAWALRYAGMAAGAWLGISWPVLVAILLHGPCFAFVYTGGQMNVDRLAGPRHRGAAQGLFAAVTNGYANLLGAVVVGISQETFLTPEGVSPPPYNWTEFWLVPALISFATAGFFLASLLLERKDTSTG